MTEAPDGTRVLVIDDDASVRDVICAYMQRAGFTVATACTGHDGLAQATRLKPHLIVLDLGLPDLSGHEVCRRLRAVSDAGILMLSAKATEDDRILGLDVGADDYLGKPFSPRELMARARALLRRSGAFEHRDDRIRFDGTALVLDPDRHEVFVYDRPIRLTPSEFRLLLALALAPGRAFTRFELVDRVGNGDTECFERTIDVHVKNLRRKIERDPSQPRWVKTVHGVGYRLTPTA